MVKKLTVVGAGSEDTNAAQRLAEKELCELLQVDIVAGIPQGEPLDPSEAAPIEKHDAHLTGTNGYAESADSDTLIITAGRPITELSPTNRIDALVDRTVNGGAEIGSLPKAGSSYFAPGSAAVEMAESKQKDIYKILTCAAMLAGGYGPNDLFSGVPARLGTCGIKQNNEIDLMKEERPPWKNRLQLSRN